MHSRCYFSITIHGNDAVTVVYSSQHLVSFGGPKVQYSCAMNTQCMQYSFHNCMSVPELWLYSWHSGCVCAIEGVEIYYVLLARLRQIT